MSIALSEEHQELARVARAFLDSHDARAASRALLEEPTEHLPHFWKEMAELGWMGLHVDESSGGQGFGLAELSIVVEELGFAMAPGPFLPTVLAAALLAERGNDIAREQFPSPAGRRLVSRSGGTRWRPQAQPRRQAPWIGGVWYSAPNSQTSARLRGRRRRTSQD